MPCIYLSATMGFDKRSPHLCDGSTCRSRRMTRSTRQTAISHPSCSHSGDQMNHDRMATGHLFMHAHISSMYMKLRADSNSPVTCNTPPTQAAPRVSLHSCIGASLADTRPKASSLCLCEARSALHTNLPLLCLTISPINQHASALASRVPRPLNPESRLQCLLSPSHGRARVQRKAPARPSIPTAAIPA